MTCRELVEMMIDYLDGDLPHEVCIRLEEHLGCCPACGHFYHSYQITIKMTRQLPAAPMPATLSEKLQGILARIEELRGKEDATE